MLRRADEWFDEHVTSVDVLKIDTEGCEVQILESLGDRAKSASIIYIEAHSETDRRAIDRMFADRYRQVFGRLLDAIGEYVYVDEAVIARDPNRYREWMRDMRRAESSRRT
jgi:hypothetical protein